MDWKAELHKELDEATTIVWQMQNGLSEGTLAVAELGELAEKLNHRSAVIQGHLARWVLWNLRELAVKVREEAGG